MQFASNPLGLIEVVFNGEREAVEAALAADGELVFDHLGETSHDVVDGRRKNVHPADHQHVISPAENAAVEPDPSRAARFQVRRCRPPGADDVASAVADHGTAGPAEGCQHQFGQFAGGGGPAAVDREKLRMKPVFDNLQAGTTKAADAPGADFGGPRMVEDGGPPDGGDPLADGGRRAARFARDDHAADRGGGRIDAGFDCHLR